MREIDSAEFSEWIAFSEMDPIGEERDDYRTGIISAMIANASGRYKKSMTPQEFIPNYGGHDHRKVMSGDELLHNMRCVVSLMGAK